MNKKRDVHENSGWSAYNSALSNETIIDKDGNEWFEVISEVGTYYCNKNTGETTYDIPNVENMSANTVSTSNTNKEIKTFQNNYMDSQCFNKLSYTENRIKNSKWVERRMSNGECYYYNTETMETKWQAPVIEPEERESNLKPTEAEPIPNSDWFIVKTQTDQLFYYNNVTQTSVWEVPVELLSNQDYHEIFATFNAHKLSKRDFAGEEYPTKEVKLSSKEYTSADSQVMSNTHEDPDSPGEKFQDSKNMKIYEDSRTKNEQINNSADFSNSAEASSDEETSSSSDSDSEKSQRNEEKVVNPISYESLKEKLPLLDVFQKSSDNMFLELSLDKRIQAFREMLQEYDVSVFSTWEKEAERMSDDPRFNVLSLKDKKHHFNEFLKTRVKNESQRTRQERDEKKLKFFDFLKTTVKDPRMKYLEFSSKYCDAEEFSIVSRVKERECFFNEYMDSFVKSTICIDPKQIKQNYWKLLDELTLDLKEAHWKNVKPLIKNDFRFLNVENSKTRKSWYRSYIKEYKAQKKLENKSKEEIALMSLKEREKEVIKEKSEIEKSRKKTRQIYENKHNIDSLNVLLNRYIQSCLVPYNSVKKIIFGKSKDGFLETMHENTIKKTITEHMKKLEERQIMLFTCTMDELIEAGTVNFGMDLNAICEIMNRTRSITIDLPDNTLIAAYNDYKSQKEQKIISNFKKLLSETKLIDLIFKRNDAASLTNQEVLDEVSNVIKSDIRFRLLSYSPTQRSEIMTHHFDDRRSAIRTTDLIDST